MLVRCLESFGLSPVPVSDTAGVGNFSRPEPVVLAVLDLPDLDLGSFVADMLGV